MPVDVRSKEYKNSTKTKKMLDVIFSENNIINCWPLKACKPVLSYLFYTNLFCRINKLVDGSCVAALTKKHFKNLA